MPLWEAAYFADDRLPVPPPMWAWPWAGGQALARYVLDHPEVVAGKRVLDVGTGGGIVAIAAALAGAAEVTAVDIEPYAIEACRLNAAANDVAVTTWEADPVDRDEGWDVVLAGDVWYEAELAAHLGPWLRRTGRPGRHGAHRRPGPRPPAGRRPGDPRRLRDPDPGRSRGRAREGRPGAAHRSPTAAADRRRRGQALHVATPRVARARRRPGRSRPALGRPARPAGPLLLQFCVTPALDRRDCVARTRSVALGGPSDAAVLAMADAWTRGRRRAAPGALVDCRSSASA